MLGMTTFLHGPTMPKSEEQLQSNFRIIDAIRKCQGNISTSRSNHVSKQNFTKLLENKFVNE